MSQLDPDAVHRLLIQAQVQWTQDYADRTFRCWFCGFPILCGPYQAMATVMCEHCPNCHAQYAIPLGGEFSHHPITASDGRLVSSMGRLMFQASLGERVSLP